jgi:hypothetical protein
MHSSRHRCRSWPPLCLRNDLPRTSGDEVDLLSTLEVEFLYRFQCSSASDFRSCVARHRCLQNFSRPSTKYMFFVGDVVFHLRLGLENINKKRTKRKLGFSKTLDWLIFFVLRMIKIKRCKRKIKRKTENIHKCKLDWILITSSPATAPEKGACWWLIVLSKFVWTCKRTSPPS